MVIVVQPSFSQYNTSEQTSDCRMQNAKNEKVQTILSFMTESHISLQLQTLH